MTWRSPRPHHTPRVAVYNRPHRVAVYNQGRRAAQHWSQLMTGNHYKWQHRWRLDAATNVWHHDSGLAVQCAATGKAWSLNGPQITALLEPQHGPHNAPAMVRRLLREAERMHASQAPKTATTPPQHHAHT